MEVSIPTIEIVKDNHLHKMMTDIDTLGVDKPFTKHILQHYRQEQNLNGSSKIVLRQKSLLEKHLLHISCIF